jgi:hypothetical protein
MRRPTPRLSLLLSPATADPFDTAWLRTAVLDAWRSSPTRFREDANVEEDYALGAYRDRLVVELAQNASDAALAAGVPGRLLLRIDDDGLTASNVGAPLDRAGVESLAAMRASSKTPGAVGRFGVGFAATLSVSDAPEIRSRDGGVRFDRGATAAILRDDAELAAHVDLRIPPLLRLPFPVDTPPEVGFDTSVVLPWRDEEARQVALDAVRAVDDALLIALPHLDEITLEIVSSTGVDSHVWQISRAADPVVIVEDGDPRYWRLESVAGEWAGDDDVSLPTEMRGRTHWTATVAIPVSEDGSPVSLPSGVPHVVHAPTPTDEPLDLPVLLVADLPLDPSRRRVVQGPRAAGVIDASAGALAAVIVDMAGEHGPAAASLIPGPALIGWIDSAMRDRVAEILRTTRWVPDAHDRLPRRPGEVVALDAGDDQLVVTLARHLDDLLDPAWMPHLGVLRSLGTPSRPVVEVWDALAPLPLSPDEWRAVYRACTALDARHLEGLPVPLADGRVVRGVRSTMLAGGHSDELAVLGVAVVHEDAEHPLLDRLGVRPFDVTQVLDAALVRRVEDAADHDEDMAGDMIAAAAALLEDAPVEPGDLVALADVPVATRDGSWRPASSVVLPGSVMDAVADPEAPRLADHLGARASSKAWSVLGVVTDLTPVTLHEQPLDPYLWDRLMADGGEWCAAVADHAGVDDPAELLAPEVTIVRGIELLGNASIDALAPLIAAPGVARALVSQPVILTSHGRRVSAPAPAAWWLSEIPILDGRCPADVRVDGDDRLEPFFPVAAAPPSIDDDVLVALGVHTTLERWLDAPDGVDEVLEALADESVQVSPGLLVDVLTAIENLDDERHVHPPDRVRVISDSQTMVVDADDAVVAIAPHHSLVLKKSYVPGTRRLADVLDLAVSDDALCGATEVAGTGVERPVPAVSGTFSLPPTYREHDELKVHGVPVDWWVTDGDEVHASTLDGLARGLAWVAGRWASRFELADALANQGDAVVLDTERLYDR